VFTARYELNIYIMLRVLLVSEQTAIISLYSINCLVFITEVGCVYCAVRAELFSKIRINLSL
jgi:hypothetical protein